MGTKTVYYTEFCIGKLFIYSQCDADSNDRRTKLNRMFLFTLRLHMRIAFLFNRTNYYYYLLFEKRPIMWL